MMSFTIVKITGRITKWEVKLGFFTIEFWARTAMKSQTLVDFIAEWTEHQLLIATSRVDHCVMYFDGSLRLEGGDARALLISPTREHLKYVLHIQFPVSNSEAEYEALLHGLCLSISVSIKRLLVYGDSMVVIK